jgi:RNA polymerase sporulation-specific sigma factor
MDDIITKNISLVYYIVKKYFNNDQELVDLGIIGLIKGVRTFNPEKKVKLETYLIVCIKNSILQYLRKKRIQTVSLDKVIDYETDESLIDMIEDKKTNTEEESITSQNSLTLRKAINKLTPDEQYIIRSSFEISGYKKKTHYELSLELEFCEDTIFRIKKRCLKKLKKELKGIYF